MYILLTAFQVEDTSDASHSYRRSDEDDSHLFKVPRVPSQRRNPAPLEYEAPIFKFYLAYITSMS